MYDSEFIVSLLVKGLIECFLSDKFVEPVEGIIVADEEDFLDIMSDGGFSVWGSRVLESGYLAIVGGIGEHDGIFIQSLDV